MEAAEPTMSALMSIPMATKERMSSASVLESGVPGRLKPDETLTTQ